ncbi:DUF6747 family protein [Sungkyunkwania multivorans]|uniref:DUF6747 family protein n=1 Tax=Sungkyunkwania multivorans TaxID=1173618 RepID=A0ABW3CY05_9FLAO
MTIFLQFKKIYTSAFKNLGNDLTATFLKAFSWFCFILIGVVIYAFIYRLLTGFAFQ